MSIIWAILSNPTILAIIAGVLGMFGVGVTQRYKGAEAERNKAAAKSLESARAGKAIDDAVAATPESDARKQLEEWGK